MKIYLPVEGDCMPKTCIFCSVEESCEKNRTLAKRPKDCPLVETADKEEMIGMTTEAMKTSYYMSRCAKLEEFLTGTIKEHLNEELDSLDYRMDFYRCKTIESIMESLEKLTYVDLESELSSLKKSSCK